MILRYLFIFIILFKLNIIAQTTQKSVININKIDRQININGKMNNPLWLLADPIEIKFEINPGDNTPAKERTIVKSLYDDEYLYFGFICFDSKPSEIRANLSERDKIFQDDYVIVLLDTYGDAQKSYEIALNPFGIQGDLMATQNGEDISFDFTWFGAAEINDSGWTAEMAIPFKSLSFEEVEYPNWKFNVVRTIPRSSRTQVSWAKFDKDIPSFPLQYGSINGLKNIKSGSSIELLPYVIGQYSGNLSDFDNPNSEYKYNNLEGRIGGGIKYSPSPSFSLDAVINPDFSQIESDAEQISVNTTFALSYEEKRPFFLIGNELLQTPMYYSRSINDPLAAGRIIGKSGALSYMYLGAFDRNTVFVVSGEEESNTAETNKNSFANVGKLRYDFGDENYIGGLVMSRNLDDGYNYLFGIDWNYIFWGNWNFEGEGFLSKTKEIYDSVAIETDRKFGSSDKTANLDGEEYAGSGIHLVLSHSQKHYEFDFVSNHFSPTYQTYNGLFNSNNFHEHFMSHEVNFYPENSFIDNWDIQLETSIKHNYEGIIKDAGLRPSIYFQFKSQTSIYVNYLLVNNEKFKGKQFNNVNRVIAFLNSSPIKGLSININGSYGKFIYRGDDPSVGFGHNLGASLTIKPNAHLNIGFSYNRAGLRNRKTDELYYDGNIFRTTAIYQFSPEAFFRTILQYNSFDKTFRIYPLFSYKLGAFTTFYTGATSNYQKYYEINEVKNTDQQYFVKFQYLFGI